MSYPRTSRNRGSRSFVSVSFGSGRFGVLSAVGMQPLRISADAREVFLPEDEGGANWTLEFRAADFIHALLPVMPDNATRLSDLDWSKSAMGACFTAGVLHGRPHWTKWEVRADSV